MSQYAKLIMITPQNNNKFYEMSWDGKSLNFDVKFGRVEGGSQSTSYPIGRWGTILKSKVKKGYKDVTEFLVKEEDVVKVNKKPTQVIKETNSKVNSFVELMKRYQGNLVKKTYSVKATSVTLKQVEEAQVILTKIVEFKKRTKKDIINEALIDLYTIIPRRMASVVDHLLPAIELKDILEQEQDNIDAMKSQVGFNTKDEENKEATSQKSFLKSIGIKMKPISSSIKALEYLMSQKTYYSSKPLKSHSIDVFELKSTSEDKKFNAFLKKQDNKKTKVLIHGTKNFCVLSIMEQGLKIRPMGNFQFSGKVYGNGNYFSETVAKSLNYTGNDNDQVLLVYEVHVGNPFIYKGWYNGNSFSLTEAELIKRGFHSTFVEAGNGLLNSEIITYNENQSRLKYLIHIKD